MRLTFRLDASATQIFTDLKNKKVCVSKIFYLIIITNKNIQNKNLRKSALRSIKTDGQSHLRAINICDFAVNQLI
jgi:hypothetical protein